MKVCSKCTKEKIESQFQDLPSQPDGLHPWCFSCVKMAYRKKYVPAELKKKFRERKERPLLADQHETIKKIVSCFLEDPHQTYAEVAKKLGTTKDTVRVYMSNNAYLRALKLMSSTKMTTMLPLAVSGFKDSLGSMNADVKLKASVKLMENENIMGPSKVDVTVTDLRSRPIEELRRIVDEAKNIPAQTIDAELVS